MAVKQPSFLPFCRVIPPEQQAEADELAAALSELQTTTAHELQEVVGVIPTLNKWEEFDKH